MKRVVVDLAQMLAELQALDLKTVSVKELIEYQTKLEFVKAGVDCSDDLPADIRAFAAQCLEYYDEIRSEFKRRGFDFSNLWDEIAENPEILVSAISSMPLLDLIAAAENLKVLAADDELIQPLYGLVLEILQQRLANYPSC